MKMKPFAIYCSTKKEILEAYDKNFKSSEELYHHFYPNRGTQPTYERKKVLREINKDFKKEFLRDDLINTNEYKFQRKILKDFDIMYKELSKADLTKKENIIRIFRCYYHPDDVKEEKLKPLIQLLEDIQPFIQKNILKNVTKHEEKKSRPSPSQSATLFAVGTVRKGNDRHMYQVKETKNKVKRWFKRKL
jgi:hypothetical protein